MPSQPVLSMRTQAFSTTNSMGRLTRNVILSFAQFEQEVTAECIRGKIASSKQKGMRMKYFAASGFCEIVVVRFSGEMIAGSGNR